MAWLKGTSKGKQQISHEIWDFTVFFPLNQSFFIHIYIYIYLILYDMSNYVCIDLHFFVC